MARNGLINTRIKPQQSPICFCENIGPSKFGENPKKFYEEESTYFY